ncbi:hypothetical protein HPB51_014498 [Rhipicephalus microplus]|uniref:Uncharacterized protein n=1 Tax=Rhipicephalus microplus TaxID=6941 RepID=A0A9J6EHT8_RHIMP|nr:hypothetical protein HPB51_014498 [Rhipicephalus microplus]
MSSPQSTIGFDDAECRLMCKAGKRCPTLYAAELCLSWQCIATPSNLFIGGGPLECRRTAALNQEEENTHHRRNTRPSLLSNLRACRRACRLAARSYSHVPDSKSNDPDDQAVSTQGQEISRVSEFKYIGVTNVYRWNHTVAVKQALQYKKGDTIGGYTVRQVEEVKELHLAAVRLLHERTGADFLHIAREDRNNHFRQEGWRLEHTDPKDKSSPIVIKGVVYNEMKGVFSNSSNDFNQAIVNKLCPSGVYGHVSGGHPLSIPDLTWEQLKEFHHKHYHPSNARKFWKPVAESSHGPLLTFVSAVISPEELNFLSPPDSTSLPCDAFKAWAGFLTYGNFPLEKTLSLIDELALSKFEKIDGSSVVPPEPRWKEPKMETMTCVPDPLAANPEKQSTVAVTYAMNEYDANLKEAFFSVGLHGVSKADIGRVTDIIHQTFDEVISTGFPKERIDAALHSVELNLKHQTSNFGLLLNYATVGLWNHGGDPVRSLKVNEHVSWLREQLASNPRFFQEKVQQYFKDNKHCLTLVMNPDEHHEEKIRALEQKNIDRKLGELDSESRASIYDQGKVWF